MEKREIKTYAKSIALELLVAELLAHHYLRAPDPVAAAAGHREYFKKLTSQLSVPGLDAALADLATGEVADAVDEILKEAEGAATQTLARRKSRL